MLKHPWTVVAVLALLLGTAVALIWGVSVRSSNGPADPAVINFVTVIISIIAASIPGLVAAAKAEQVHEDMKNGVFKEKMKEAIIETVDDKNNDVKGFFYNKESGHVDGITVIVMTGVAVVVVAIAFLVFR